MRWLAGALFAVWLGGCVTTVEQGPPPAPPPPPPPAEPVQLEPAPAEAPVAEIPTEDPGEITATSEPPAPASDHVWIPGYWNWVDGQWAWSYGYWRAPMVGYTYVAPYYEVVGGQV